LSGDEEQAGVENFYEELGWSQAYLSGAEVEPRRSRKYLSVEPMRREVERDGARWSCGYLSGAEVK